MHGLPPVAFRTPDAHSEDVTSPEARQRYFSAMATIQIRDIPPDAYETIKRRAEENGQSLQAYMREQVIELARQEAKTETLTKIKAWVEETGGLPLTSDEVAALIREGRGEA